MSNSATRGRGTTISIAEGSPISYQTIGEVTQMGGPSRSNRTSEVTHTESTAAEFIRLVRDEGEFQVTCNFIPDDAGQSTLRSVFEGETGRASFQIVFTDGNSTTYTFNAIVTQYNTPMDVGSHLVCTFSLRIDDTITES